jgi:prophage tail gpP-like protein
MYKVIVKNATTKQELLWRSVKIRKSLDEICHTLELELSPGERSKVRRHDKIKVECKNPLVFSTGGLELITTALVDEVTASSDVTKNSLTVVGRSPARDIIDSTWSDTCSDMTLRQITRHIGNRFGIACDTFPLDPDPTKVVSAFGWENESPWTKLITESDNQGYIFTSNQAGGLYLWPVASTARSEGFHITEGVNVKNIRWTENGSEQFHEYVVSGGGGTARVSDPTCRGNRILTINLTDTAIGEATLSRRAKTEMNRRKETRTTVTVPGWGLADDQIKKLGTSTYKKELYWFPNSIIPVRIPTLGLDAKLLICELEMTATADTMGCDITLVNREAYL